MDRTARSADDAPFVPPRLWAVPEANLKIGELDELLPRLAGWVARLGEVQNELQRLGEFWGEEVDAADHVDHEIKARLDAEWKNLSRRLEEAMAALRTEGIEVKSLENGLVDFYGLVDDEVVYLCWQRGEREVGFYHTLTGGFSHRRPLPLRGRVSPGRTRGSA
jgi:hypothetical protein